MATIVRRISSSLTFSRPVRTVALSRNGSRWRSQPPCPHHALNHARLSTRAHSKRATEEDERLIEEMKRAAEKGDLLEGGIAGALLKVLAIAAAVGIVVVLTYLAQPVIQNTVASFPSAS